MGRHVRDGALDIWVEQAGEEPDVLLIAGLGDTVEAWQFRGPVSVEAMADDAAGVLRAVGIGSAHVAGFSAGSIFGQELALRHVGLVRSLVLQSTWWTCIRRGRTTTAQ